jgi:hypothetical protein
MAGSRETRHPEALGDLWIVETIDVKCSGG